MRICAFCNKTDEDSDPDDVLLYGEWMTKLNVTVHYFCLLLSTNLVQRGGDSGGILGFLLRDIRKEVKDAQLRKCVFCIKPGASLECHNCHMYFHLGCGLDNRCVNYFCDDYRSYCEKCAPRDEYQRQLLATSMSIKNVRCDICFRKINLFMLSKVVYGDCCRKGFAHKNCMRRYAIASGYYLRCLWCRDAKFHDTIKLQSVYVPDRDASWERQKNAYSELHKKIMRCDQPECLCPHGRDYNRHRWSIQLCVLCAAYGAHFKCRSDGAVDLKCEFCQQVEAKLKNAQASKEKETTNDQIDTSAALSKKSGESSTLVSDDDVLVPTDEDVSSNEASIVTVVASQRAPIEPAAVEAAATVDSVEDAANIEESSVIELPDSQQITLILPQPPLLLCKSFTHAEHFYLQVFDYQEEHAERCMGTWTLRFTLDDPRLQDRSEQALQQLQPTKQDIWTHDKNRGIYDKIDQYTK
ncbi:hypothetical protein KR093_000141 [Drosophila rubida]|uniref:PHD-type domain-containing protein n=1 Tax=Drosophila rubida TaxID=30044 RepID=A0AAD4PN01_9MUSC|nr:hypothetical protein KR093_000141 [Drosophila rubida]